MNDHEEESQLLDPCSDVADLKSCRYKHSRNRKRNSHGLNLRNRNSSTSEEESSSTSTSLSSNRDCIRDNSNAYRFVGMPTSTSCWDVDVLKRLGIYYNRNFHSSPCDILDLIYHKTGVFGPLSNVQMEYVKSLQNSITYSCSVTEILGVKNMLNVDELITKMKNDIDNLRNDQTSGYNFASVVEDFITSTRLMIKYQIAHLTQDYHDYRKDPVPQDIFVDMFKVFVKMCQLLPVAGSVWKSDMHFHRAVVESESDVVLMTKDHLDDDSLETVSVVSIVGVDKLTLDRQDRECMEEKQTETKPSKSTPCSSAESFNGEDSAYQEYPAIFENMGLGILGQHGGKLLLHHRLYGKKLSRGKAFKYLPGMIVIGTEVTFTVLALNGDHVRELETLGRSDRNKAYIYYSQPKDLLKKEDRDLLIESFVRLNNQKAC